MTNIVCPNCEEEFEIYQREDSYICPECEHEFEEDEIENKNSSSNIFGLIILLVIGYFLFQWLSGPKWTLLVCEDLLNSNYRYECRDVALSLEDTYKDLNDCRVAGERYLNSYPGYECGYKCKYDTSWMGWVCKRINE
jgi:DNA-directed RNA polymerase subunit RPC12/RpoP